VAREAPDAIPDTGHSPGINKKHGSRTAIDRGCVKTIDDSFVGAKDRDLVERGSILGEFLEHGSSEFCESSFLFLHCLDPERSSVNDRYRAM
jgi:hypothetical protein